MQVRLINGDDIEADHIEMQGQWVVARVQTAVKNNSRAIPRENIEQIIVGDNEAWDSIAWATEFEE